MLVIYLLELDHLIVSRMPFGLINHSGSKQWTSRHVKIRHSKVYSCKSTSVIWDWNVCICRTMTTVRSPDLSSSAESGYYTEPDLWYPRLQFPVTRSAMLSGHLLGLRASRNHGPVTRRKKEAIPSDKKDAAYWVKRLKNNEAAKRSREKKKFKELVVEGQLLALSDENARLRAQMFSIQYRSSLAAEKSKAVEASALPPAHTPTLFQPRLWGDSRGSPTSALALKQNERALHPFEANVSLDPYRTHSFSTQQGLSPLSVSRVHSPIAVLQGQRSAEVPSIDDTPNISNTSHSASSIRVFQPTPDTLCHASMFSYPTPGLIPHLNHPTVCNNSLPPWRSSYLPPPAVYPGLLLTPNLQMKQGQNLSVEAGIQRGLNRPFCHVPTPTRLPQPGWISVDADLMHWLWHILHVLQQCEHKNRLF